LDEIGKAMSASPLPGNGVLAVDKPSGPTSHDVVGQARRLLGTRRIGHAGTLDPMASGVLVLLVGEATKLAPYLSAHDKRYRARVAFGLATETLDREGAPVATAEIPPWLTDELAAIAEALHGPKTLDWPRIAAALAAERARSAQVPPAYSAIKVDGQRSYARARAGEAVDLAPRPVEVTSLEVVAAGPDFFELDLVVSKGYYVRSLARDLGAHLGVPSHLAELRRTASGPFTLAEAVELLAMRPAAVLPLTAAARRSLPHGRMTEAGTRRARQGKVLEFSDFMELPPFDTPSAWLDGADHLVAIGTRRRDGFVLHRGFADHLDRLASKALPPLPDEPAA
jgi:tRNA pseudouridine55 synthase